jgi:hypothetical protein
MEIKKKAEKMVREHYISIVQWNQSERECGKMHDQSETKARENVTLMEQKQNKASLPPYQSKGPYIC